VFETQSYYPQFVPKSNRDQQKKNPQKELFPPSSLFLLKKLRWFGRNPRRRCRGGLGETPGGGAEVVWAKSQAEVQRWSGQNPRRRCRCGGRRTRWRRALAVDGLILAMAFVGERSGLLRKIAFNVVLFPTVRFCS
jgi:hypothetical protein